MKKLLFAAAAVWLLAACNKELGPEYETPPVFDEVTFTTATQPDKITEPVKVDEVVWVNATVSCPYKVKQVWLAYFVDGDESNVVTTKPFNYDATTVTFKERIPGQKAGAKVSFQVLTRSDYVFVDPDVYLQGRGRRRRRKAESRPAGRKLIFIRDIVYGIKRNSGHFGPARTL